MQPSTFDPQDNDNSIGPSSGVNQSNDRIQVNDDVGEEDASRKEVAIYAFGNVEASITDSFPVTLQNILIVVAHVSPLMLGLILALKTLWDSITDPILAHISDNTRSRFGRRRPYILVGGVSRVLFLSLFVYFMPIDGDVSNNAEMEIQKHVNESADNVARYHGIVAKIYAQIDKDTAETQKKLIGILEGDVNLSWISQLLNVFSTKEDMSYLTRFSQSLDILEKYLPILNADLKKRERLLQEAEAALEAVRTNDLSTSDSKLIDAENQLETARSRIEQTASLIEKTLKAESMAIAGKYATLYLLNSYGQNTEPDAPSSPAEAQALAEGQMEARGLNVIGIFESTPPPKANPIKKPSLFSNVSKGIQAFLNPSNTHQFNLIIYLLVGYLIYATLSTIVSSPYYALGIEISPSYNGRTRVVVYRSVLNKIAGIAAVWVPVFCFSLLFDTAFQGLFWVTVITCLVGIPSTVLMFFKTKERTHVKKTARKVGFFKSMLEISKEPNFLRMLYLFLLVGLVVGIFEQIGFFLNIYWVSGSALSGATLSAKVGMFAWTLSLLSLPLVKSSCDRFQKHRVLQFAIIWMAIGTALKWWLITPEHPEYQYILPFFFSIGISSVYAVLPSMMADITDLDELNHGVRREGMFGAVMSFLLKMLGAVKPILAGAILVISGFNAELEYQQDSTTITNLRLLFSFVPACFLLFALIGTIKYPLTRERINEIKGQLQQRRDTDYLA